MYLIIVAYFTKKKLNEDMLIYDCYFESQIQNFKKVNFKPYI